MNTIKLCPECCTPLPPDAPSGLCPQCLLKSHPASTAGEEHPPLAVPLPGAVFGGYRIIRLLGEGGMGAAYEAEDLENGRRVALKVLRHTPDSPTARQRFLREGRLAASVNHPNTVYIFGSEEIEGAPVITMEYVSGGTLQERVKRQGPLSVSGAVDAILQIIAGLEAAADKGVLHRDVKPANCFVEADGTVKVGDFGLSISTFARDHTALTMAGLVMGTPEYASPEQLRGDELDARADIYSVGVTLYFLLTGKTPFKGENLAGLIATVLEKPAPPPRSIRREIPNGVEQIVLRCLAKQPQQRFKNYAQLREALLPFCSTARTPATLDMRFAAGTIDVVFWMCVAIKAAIGFFSSKSLDAYSDCVIFALAVLYFPVLEGFWGVTLGKWICRLRVVGPNRNFPGFPRALARYLLFWVVPSLPILLMFLPFFYASSSGQRDLVLCILSIMMFSLLFVSARRRNGYAALHDLLTETRVIELAVYEHRPKLSLTDDFTPHTSATPTIGPFHVLGSLARQDKSEILLGYDPRLLRKVWICRQPSGTAPIPAFQRDLNRKGRLHWLASRRSETECWDAYEALAGQPLVKLLNQPQPWKSVRYWLLDLAEELEAARLDGSWPDALTLDRVWVTAEGRAKLLDFPVPGTSAEATQGSQSQMAGTISPPVLTTPQQLLDQVADAALLGRGLSTEIQTGTPPTPLPISVRKFLTNLPTAPDVRTALLQLRPLLEKPAALSRARRQALLAGCVAVPVFVWICTLWSGCEASRRMPDTADAFALHQGLAYLKSHATNSNGTPTNVEYNAVQIYVVSHFRSTITNDQIWADAMVRFLIPAANRQLAEQALADHPAPSETEIREADDLVYLNHNPPELGYLSHDQMLGIIMEWQRMPPLPSGGLRALYILIWIAWFSVLFTLLNRRGPLLRLLGIEIVTKDGLPARRWRTLLRSLLTWLPLLLLNFSPLFVISWGSGSGLLVVLLSLLVFFGGAAYALLRPERSFQDRLAGTWLVLE